jgi:CheY-like chemotaxis protein
MKNIILCTSNPILVKSLYGVLRDDGHSVETVEHPAFAVQVVMQKQADLVIIDAEPFGLSAQDAAEIIKSVSPATKILTISEDIADEDSQAEGSIDLEHLSQMIHSMAA